LENTLYFGDNLPLLRQFIKDDSIDLIYLDPPFNSKSNYNVIFKTPENKEAASQITAFEDTWHWHTGETEYEFNQLIKGGGVIAEVMKGMELVVGKNDLLAYLTMMAIRLRELYRVLKDTGSLYLHCDPTASHYLKIILDAIFEARNFRNEIIWKRSGTSPGISKNFRKAHDIILRYSKDQDYIFNQQFQKLSDVTAKKYSLKDEIGFYRKVPILVSGKTNGDTGQIWKGVDPHNYGINGMHWVTQRKKLDDYDKQNKIVWGKGKLPQLKYYLHENKGLSASDIWDDIAIINSMAKERMGYPTQKPLALLERIIKASSNEGDIILDPFCGCGTAIVAAQKLKRKWIGMDITHLAVGLMEQRIKELFGITPKVIGNPASFNSAENLFKRSPLDFERWAVTRIDGIHPNKKQVGDGGVDGRGYIGQNGEHKVIVSVKGGKTLTPSMVAQLIGVMEKEHANFGILITIHKPTDGMLKEAISQGFVEVGLDHFPKIQIWTISDYFNGKKPDLP